MKSEIKLILAEDYVFIRQAFVHLLTTEGHFNVIAQASNGKELLELLALSEPDIVLLDLDMPVMDGHTALKILKEKYPQVKVIILSNYNSKEIIDDVLQNGASAFLSKDCSPEDLFKTIKSVYATS